MALLELVNYLTVAKPSFNDRVLCMLVATDGCGRFGSVVRWLIVCVGVVVMRSGNIRDVGMQSVPSSPSIES